MDSNGTNCKRNVSALYTSSYPKNVINNLRQINFPTQIKSKLNPDLGYNNYNRILSKTKSLGDLEWFELETKNGNKIFFGFKIEEIISIVNLWIRNNQINYGWINDLSKIIWKYSTVNFQNFQV